MHEAGLAAGVAKALRAAGLEREGPRLRLVVQGGHHEPADFDAALRLHLETALPEFDQERMRIVHAPSEAKCVACGHRFMSVEPIAICPECGGSALSTLRSESIVLEWEDAPPA